MTRQMATVALRVGLVLVAVPLMMMSLLGVLGNRPLPCEGVSCIGDDLRGSLLWAMVFGVPFLAAVVGGVVSAFGKLKMGSLVLAFAAVALGVAIFV